MNNRTIAEYVKLMYEKELSNNSDNVMIITCSV